MKLDFVLIGLVTAAVTGLLAGLAPAAAAAKLDAGRGAAV